MNLAQALVAPQAHKQVQRDKPVVPKVGDPGTYEWNGSDGTYFTQPTLEQIHTWDEYIKDAGLDPNEVEVVEPVQVRGWDSVKREWNDELKDFESNVVRMHYYRLTLRLKRTGPTVQHLYDIVKNRKKPTKAAPTGDSTFVVAIGDLQLGKIDGDGLEGTWQRALDGLERAAERLKAARKFHSIGNVHVAWLGDCIEGFVSQNGASAWRTPLPLTDQVDLLERLMLYSVEILSPLTENLTEVAVPGNHDQAVRFGRTGTTTFDDSFDVLALRSVERACSLSAAYRDTTFIRPEHDELTVTVETSGTILGHIHGHQTKLGKHFDWWQKQSFGDQPIGQADVLLAGHFHHFVLDTSGTRKFIQVPALESESTYFRHTHGQVGDPGVLTFLTRDKKINLIEIV